MARADFHELSAGPQVAARALTTDRRTTNMVHTRGIFAVASRDVDHVAVRVHRESGLIAGVIVAELTHTHRLTFRRCNRPWPGRR